MIDQRFGTSSVLLYDPQSTLRHNTRVALLDLGFGEVEAVQNWSEFLQMAEKNSYDLIVGDLVTREGSLEQIIKRVRHNDLGSNPFVNIIVTLWHTTPESVNEGIQAGADDILSRPMSANQLSDRVHGLITARKPFIVTEDYIGPDRRQIVRGLSQPGLMVVPNSLKAKVENRPEFDATPENIELALSAVKDRQVSILTEQFLRLSTKVMGLGTELQDIDARHEMIGHMIEMNNNLQKIVFGTEYAHIEALISAFDDVLSRIKASVKPLSEQDQELMFQIPFAIHTACKEVRHSASLAFDIEQVSQQLRGTGTS
ncbi:response regulator [Sneathiella limimaris]|uniref:response regulator n=1 Tax=Sneathiella limimaris TaxID=1964213 RepID=UPI00146D7F59|nr:response regulator [Sneathiella limimaris]